MKKLPTLDHNRIITNDHTPEINDVKKGVMILVNKPLEWTSFDVVNKIRSSLKYGIGIKKMKVGHSGTLDPMASGLLLICVGNYTKLIDHLTVKSKTYIAQVKFGSITATYDSEAPEEDHKSINHLSQESIQDLTSIFIGELQQVPPIYSALKINGQSAHKLARRGKDVELKARSITILSNTLIECNLPYVSFEVECSKGTYIRSLAHDMGQSLEVGAYLSRLKRTRIGTYNLQNAMSIEEVVQWIDRLPEQIED